MNILSLFLWATFVKQTLISDHHQR